MTEKDSPPNEITKADLVRLVSAALRVKKWSGAKLAREIGVAPSTVTRALNPDIPHLMSASSISKLVRIVAESRSDLEEKIGGHLREMSEIGALRATTTVTPIPILGNIQPGAWLDARLIKPTPGHVVYIRDPAWPKEGLAAFEVVGKSSDREFSEGTIVVVLECDKSLARAGDIVLIRRQVDTVIDTKIETSLYDVTIDNGERTFTSRHTGELEKLSLKHPVMKTKFAFFGTVIATATFRPLPF